MVIFKYQIYLYTIKFWLNMVNSEWCEVELKLDC